MNKIKTIRQQWVDETGGVLTLSREGFEFVLTLSNIKPVYHEEIVRTINENKANKYFDDFISAQNYKDYYRVTDPPCCTHDCSNERLTHLQTTS